MNELKELEKQISELEKFENELSRTQLKFPLDKESQETVAKDILMLEGFSQPPGIVSTDLGLKITINDKKYRIAVTEIVS